MVLFGKCLVGPGPKGLLVVTATLIVAPVVLLCRELRLVGFSVFLVLLAIPALSSRRTASA